MEYTSVGFFAQIILDGMISILFPLYQPAPFMVIRVLHSYWIVKNENTRILSGIII